MEKDDKDATESALCAQSGVLALYERVHKGLT
jgi:hypothetical protein